MTSTHQAQNKIRVVRPPNTPIIYIEGIAEMLVGFPNSRVTLSQLSRTSGEGESQEDVHHLACELVVPTGALIELAQGILTNLANRKEALQGIGTEWMQKVNEVIQTLPTADSTEQKP
jgi:hypothetical protein